VFVASYANIVERAQYARSEPSEEDAAATEKVVALIRNLLEVRRERERGYNEKSDRDRPPVGGKLEYPYPEKAVESDESEF
jgi:hypothetical protein